MSFAISALIVKSLVDAGLPRDLIWKMVLNIVLDLAIGAIPVVGDFWDFFNKANRKILLWQRPTLKTVERKVVRLIAIPPTIIHDPRPIWVLHFCFPN